MTSVRVPSCGARPSLRLTYCLMSLAILAGIARAATYPALFVYGDSMSDSNGVLGSWKAYRGPPSPPYARVWSNGPTWPYYLAQSMGLSCPYADFNTDAGIECPVWRNYATGGACSKNWGLSPGESPICTDFGVPSTYFYPYQVETHNNASINATLNREGLHIIDIGLNDIVMYFATGFASAPFKALVTAEAIRLGVETLYNGGARHFFLVNTHSFTSPDVLSSDLATRELLDEFIQQYAEGYHSNVVVPLRSQLTNATITEINMLGCYNQMGANCTFRELGFTNWDSPCIHTQSDPSSSKCSDPSKYIFWDTEGHHTTAFHQVLAGLYKDVIDGKANACLQTACLGDSPLDSCPGGLDIKYICESGNGNAAAPGGLSLWAMVGVLLMAVLALGLSF